MEKNIISCIIRQSWLNRTYFYVQRAFRIKLWFVGSPVMKNSDLQLFFWHQTLVCRLDHYFWYQTLVIIAFGILIVKYNALIHYWKLSSYYGRIPFVLCLIVLDFPYLHIHNRTNIHTCLHWQLSLRSPWLKSVDKLCKGLFFFSFHFISCAQGVKT